VAGQQHGASAFTQRLRVELHPHEEHVQHHPDLAERAQHFEARGREEGGRRSGGQQPEERGPEQDARQHLAHHVGLAQPAHGQSAGPRGEEYREDLHEQETDGGLSGAAGGASAAATGAAAIGG